MTDILESIALAERRAARPALLGIGAWGSLLFSVVIGIGLVAVLVVKGPIEITGRNAATESFGRVATLIFVSLWLIDSAIAYGLWREKLWARPLMIAFWLVYGAWQFVNYRIDPHSRQFALPLAFMSCLSSIFIAIWYLYIKENVVAYYRSLAPSQASA